MTQTHEGEIRHTVNPESFISWNKLYNVSYACYNANMVRYGTCTWDSSYKIYNVKIPDLQYSYMYVVSFLTNMSNEDYVQVFLVVLCLGGRLL